MMCSSLSPGACARASTPSACDAISGATSAGGAALPYSVSAARFDFSLIAQRLDRVEGGGVVGGVKPADHAEHDREEHRADHEPGGDEEQRVAARLAGGVARGSDHEAEKESRDS